MCSAPNVYMFVYILIGTHMVPLKLKGMPPKMLSINTALNYFTRPAECPRTKY